LNSTNGVYLGEKQIKKHRLLDGDVVTIGDHELIYSDLRKRESANEGEITDVLDAEEDGVVVGE
nr:FHA domain-containing protein [Woeseiaceae bacterium]